MPEYKNIFRYEKNDDHIEIIEFYNSESVIIPEEIDNLPVTELGVFSFLGRDLLKSIKIPDNIKIIRELAFLSCHNLESVTISKGVNQIAWSTFSDCKNLKSVIIPKSVIELGNNAFSNCTSLTSIKIPNSIKIIDDYAFYGCESLTNVKIPESVERIGNGAFAGCKNLKEIKVSNNNKNYISKDGILFNKDMTKLIKYPDCKTEYIIPDSVKIIGEVAFSYIENLKSIIIPESIEIIGNCAFRRCKNLDTVIIKNPKCEIFDNESTISNFEDENYYIEYFNGIIYGYENSTAQAYAEKYGYKFALIDSDKKFF